jgi:hypothetical protein
MTKYYNKKDDKVDPELNKAITEAIHNYVVEAMIAKGKIVYDMTLDELDNLRTH